MFDTIKEAKKTITALKHDLERKGEPTDTEVFGIICTLQQMFDIGVAVDTDRGLLVPVIRRKLSETCLEKLLK